MPSLARFTSALLVLSAIHAPALAQNVPVRTLSRPDAEFAEPFTQVSGVRELRDGRVIVIDPRDKTVQRVDFKTGAAQKVGREGSGPGEYALPMRLIALPADSSAVYDPLNNRLLVITPGGAPGGFLDMSTAGRSGRGGMMVIGGAAALSTDSRGMMYMQGSPFRIVNEAPQPSDSISIERWNRASGKRDTLAFLQLPKGANQVSASGRGMQVRIGGGGPYASQDQWAVGPDGRIAIVHVEPYRVEFINANGSRTSGQAIRFDRVRLTEGHKQQWRDQQRGGTAIMMSVGPSGQRTATAGPPPNVQEPAEWPEFLPPFTTNAVTFASDGMLWVRRTTPADQPPTYDVIDGNGRVASRVVLPRRARLVGFGNGTVYLVRLDEDDLQYLQRYRLPAAERP